MASFGGRVCFAEAEAWLVILAQLMPCILKTLSCSHRTCSPVTQVQPD